MGQTLSEPVVEKHSESGEDERVAYGISAMQGWRINMEDAHAAVLDLQVQDAEKETVPATKEKRISYFGVYDGHGGDKVAIYTGENLHKIISQQEAFKEGDFEQALKDGFLAIDRAILSDPRYEDEVSGCTSVVTIVTSSKIFCGNAGDSRAVLGVCGRAKPLSFDHKPTNEGEKARIVAANGFVDFGRVNGNLALSRAIGDFEFKKGADLPPEEQIVTAFPDVTEHDLSEDDEFIVVACDGIWDCQSSQAVIEFVRRGVAAKQELHKICENLMDNCLAPSTDQSAYGSDNMSVIIVALLNGKTKEQWYDMVADRVAKGEGPCAPPEYAEFRGPGIQNRFDDSPDDFDMDMDQRTRLLGGRAGRIILLGDGTEILTSHGDEDDEDIDMDGRGEAEEVTDEAEKTDANGEESARSQREETPAPTGDSSEDNAPEKPKIMAATDSADTKKVLEDAAK